MAKGTLGKEASSQADRSNRKAVVLREATRLFSEKGFRATTIRDIASAAGMRSGSPFYHFSSKQEILLCAITEGLSEALVKHQQIVAQPTDAKERLVQLITSQLQALLLQKTELTPLLFHEKRSLDAEGQKQVLCLKNQHHALWQSLLDELSAQGRLKSDSPLLRQLLIGATNEVPNWYRADGAMSIEEIAENIVAVFVV